MLPFGNSSGDPENDFLGDGVAEELINTLNRIRGLKVIARTSSFLFRGTALDLQAVGKRLGVTTILQGSVRKSADRISLAAQLIRATDQTQVWSDTYDRELSGIFATEEDIARAMAGAFNLEFSAGRQPTVSLEGRSPTDASGALCACFLMPSERFGEALAECQRALETDPLSMMLHFALTYMHYWRRDFAGAKKVAEKALDIGPGFWLMRSALAMASSSWVNWTRQSGTLVWCCSPPRFTRLPGGFWPMRRFAPDGATRRKL